VESMNYIKFGFDLHSRKSRFRRRSHRRSNPVVDLELWGTFCPETNAPKPAEARCRWMCLCSCILSPGHGHLESQFCQSP
jgi:hypothetical protein